MPPLQQVGTTNINMYGASAGVLDLGNPEDHKPLEAVVQADLRTNSTYRVGILVCKAGSNELGTNFASACTGGAFTNQPSDDGIEVVSDDATDTNRTVTIYGTTTATNVVTAETITLTGDSAASAVKTDWGEVLGVTASAAHATATVTIREASANQTITTIAATATTSSVTAVASGSEKCYGLPFRATPSADPGADKKVGVIGTDSIGNTLYDSLTLPNGAALAVRGTRGLAKVTHLLHGDLPANKTATFDIGNLTYGAASATLLDAGTQEYASSKRLALNHRYLHWCLYDGTSLAPGGADDRLLITLYG